MTLRSSLAVTVKMSRKAETSSAVTTPSALAIFADRAIMAIEKATCRRAAGSAILGKKPPAHSNKAPTAPAPPSTASPIRRQMLMVVAF